MRRREKKVVDELKEREKKCRHKEKRMKEMERREITITAVKEKEGRWRDC